MNSTVKNIPDEIGSDADGPGRGHGHGDDLLVGLAGLARDHPGRAQVLHAEVVGGADDVGDAVPEV